MVFHQLGERRILELLVLVNNLDAMLVAAAGPLAHRGDVAVHGHCRVLRQFNSGRFLAAWYCEAGYRSKGMRRVTGMP